MKLLKDLSKVFAVAVIITVIYLIYFYLVGVPRTQARYRYNQGLIALEQNDKDKAREEFQKGLSFWQEDYIKVKLNEIID